MAKQKTILADGQHADLLVFNVVNVKLKNKNMKIQFNTDKNVQGNEELSTFITSLISKQLSRFEDQITRLEVHLSDEDGKKEGFNNIRCMLEARIEGRAPLGVTAQANTHQQAVTGAVEKLKVSLETIYGRLRNR